MAVDATPDDRELTLPPLDEKVDHVRGSATGRLIIEYGDYECPYSRQAFHAIEPSRTAAWRKHAVRVPALSADQHPSARFRRGHRGRGSRSAGPVLGHARAAVPPAEGARRRRPARGTPPSLASTWRRSNATGPASRWQRGSAATLTAAWLRARCLARRPCSSTASSTAAATTRPPCWPRWRRQGDQKPRRSLTMIAVTRLGVITLLMIRMLFTPLGTP